MTEPQEIIVVVAAILLLSFGCVPTDDSQQSTTPTMKGGPSSQCEDLENLLERIECYVTVATDEDDPSLCGQSSHEGVKYQCYAILAERRSSEALCRVIPSRSPDQQNLRDICISDVAKKILSPPLCEEIETVGLRDSCYAKIGQETGNMALCENIQDPGLRSLCSGQPVRVQ